MSGTLELAIGFFRRQREAQFRAECRVERRGEGTFDENTGAITPAAPTIVFEGACNVRQVAWMSTDAQSGEREIRLVRAEILLPHDTPVEEDDVIVVTKATHDADLVGQEYRITDVFFDAWQISRRAIGERIARGA